MIGDLARPACRLRTAALVVLVIAVVLQGVALTASTTATWGWALHASLGLLMLLLLAAAWVHRAPRFLLLALGLWLLNEVMPFLGRVVRFQGVDLATWIVSDLASLVVLYVLYRLFHPGHQSGKSGRPSVSNASLGMWGAEMGFALRLVWYALPVAAYVRPAYAARLTYAWSAYQWITLVLCLGLVFMADRRLSEAGQDDRQLLYLETGLTYILVLGVALNLAGTYIAALAHASWWMTVANAFALLREPVWFFLAYLLTSPSWTAAWWATSDRLTTPAAQKGANP